MCVLRAFPRSREGFDHERHLFYLALISSLSLSLYLPKSTFHRQAASPSLFKARLWADASVRCTRKRSCSPGTSARFNMEPEQKNIPKTRELRIESGHLAHKYCDRDGGGSSNPPRP